MIPFRFTSSLSYLESEFIYGVGDIISALMEEFDPGAPVQPSTEHPVGEGFETDMRKPMALRANRLLRKLTKAGANAEIELGEHGSVDINNVRFRDALKEGHLLAYVRQETGEHKVITVTVALGVVAAGIYAMKHRKK
ncbi:hypothetical protein A3J32_02590 [Candidatus Saccharibacteria bacterium RIFCSPLOWO2_02_FULL_46_7]|nr:MAG: hypothetical protein A3J32_02590 [Candidatus Saccharibacteria bacterium RIFCSPLOWO2_02_FULL_46_7]